MPDAVTPLVSGPAGTAVKTPEVSVVIPARDAERFVGEAVASVRRQTLGAWEIVVVDDGSTDGTAEVAAGAGDERLRVIPGPRMGVARARNAGLAAAAGEFVLFLDADDRLRPRALELLHGALRSEPLAVVAYAAYVKMDEHGLVRGPTGPLRLTRYPSGRVLEAALEGCFVKTPGAALVRRDALERVGGFDPDLEVAEDWGLWCHLATLGTFVYVRDPEALVEYRLHPTAATRGYRFAVYRRTVEHVFSSPRIRAAVPPDRLAQLERRQLAFVCRFLAIQRLRERQRRRARRYLRRALLLRRTDARAMGLFALALLPRLPRILAERAGIWDA